MADPDSLLAEATVAAAVDALATRNAHHLEQMTPEERADAEGHWRELALDVLTAARATIVDGGADAEDAADQGPVQRGRAVIVLEDAGEEDVAVHATFHPELEEIGQDELAGTPAQIAAMGMLQQLLEGDEGDPGEAL
ncbi:MAG TPA: hypothetical protein VD931_08365 [Baekduia sp.]|nr:hypothetical protein [Baekduia sp.]